MSRTDQLNLGLLAEGSRDSSRRLSEASIPTPAPPAPEAPRASNDEVPRASRGSAGASSIAARIVELAQRAILTNGERGELDTLLERHLNTASTPQMRKFLYDTCGFAPHYIKEGNRNSTRLACDVGALLSIYRTTRDKRAELCLRLSDRRNQLEVLASKLDQDNRIRCSFNIAGGEVGRMAAYPSNTGSGYPLHTTSARHKHLFLADEGFDLYSVDLKSADGWTIGAECKALGDSRMLDDLSTGLKPANAIALLYEHGLPVNAWEPQQLLAAQKRVDKNGWLYKACKRVIWGTCYGMQSVRMSEQILEDGWKVGGELVYVSAADCKQLQGLVFARYPGIQRRIERIKMLLKRDGYLVAASGQRRDFFGRKDDYQTVKDALPFTPAANTAYLNHRALLNLWNDPECAPTDTRLVQPLIEVHDSVVFQAPIPMRDWVAKRIPLWWNNPLCVTGTTFTIPYEASVGPNWGDLQPLG